MSINYCRNPKTNRGLRIGSPTFKTLVRAGIIDNEGNEIKTNKEVEDLGDIEDLPTKTLKKTIKRVRRKKTVSKVVKIVDHGLTDKEMEDFLEEYKGEFQGLKDEELVPVFNRLYEENYEDASDEE